MTETASEPRPHPAECDLVMRTGSRAGVVYPKPIMALEDNDYLFRNVGGTSVGAIAAAVVAAAEYGRQLSALAAAHD